MATKFIRNFVKSIWKAFTENKGDAARSSMKRLQENHKRRWILQAQEVFFYAIFCSMIWPKDLPFFDEVGLARHDKHDILKPLEDLQEEDYKLNPNNDLKTAVIVDFMSMIGKVPF